MNFSPPSAPSWQRTYDSLFLTKEDLSELQPSENVHSSEPERGDLNFLPCGGKMMGFNAWQVSNKNGPYQRIVDIRWFFDTLTGARRYHRLQMRVNSEQGTTLPDACAWGEGGKIFTLSDPFGVGLEMKIFLFTIQQVGIKVFFANIPPKRQEEILACVVSRVRDALARGSLPEKPLPESPQTSERWPKGELAYESLLLGQQLLPGKGISDLLTFDHAISDMYKLIGGGDETPDQPLAYFFVKGSFALAVRGEFSRATGTVPILQIRYWDDPYAGLKTPEGLSIGNTRNEVLEKFGTPLNEAEGWLHYSGIAFKIGQTCRVDCIDIVPFAKK